MFFSSARCILSTIAIYNVLLGGLSKKLHLVWYLSTLVPKEGRREGGEVWIKFVSGFSFSILWDFAGFGMGLVGLFWTFGPLGDKREMRERERGLE